MARSPRTGNDAIDRQLQYLHKRIDELSDNGSKKATLKAYSPVSKTVTPVVEIAGITSTYDHVRAIEVTGLKAEILKLNGTPIQVNNSSTDGEKTSESNDYIKLSWNNIIHEEGDEVGTYRVDLQLNRVGSGYVNEIQADGVTVDSSSKAKFTNYVIMARIEEDQRDPYKVLSMAPYPIEYSYTNYVKEWFVFEVIPIDPRVERVEKIITSLPFPSYLSFWVGALTSDAVPGTRVSLYARKFNEVGANINLRTSTTFPNGRCGDGFLGEIFIQRSGSKSFSSNIVSGLGAGGYGWALSSIDNVDTTSDRPKVVELEVDNLRVRNKLSVMELLFQQIRATNGTLLVATTGKVKKIVRKKDDGK
ncbi:MAG: hypothetical protein KKA84_12120 [Bacteroidetes bacterium]|nr:hypothetical protein [Bacteroidota bacterium]